MAYWIINFKSIGGTSYRLRIGGKSGNTNAELLGAAQPFTTAEDDSDDKFTPVRTQSGYIRILDDGKDLAGNAFDWHDLVPDTAFARPVTCYTVTGSTLTLRWTGYIRPATYGGSYPPSTVEVREFPVCCLLAAMEAVNMNGQQNNVVTFAGLLDLLAAETGIAPTYLYFTGQHAIDWLYAKLDLLNLQGKTMLEALKAVCTFWGWTCRTYGNDIYFEAADDTVQQAQWAWARIEGQDLGAIEEGRTVQATQVSWSVRTPGDDFYASINGTETIVQGVKKVTVRAGINKISGYPSVPFSYILEQFATQAWSQVQQWGSGSGAITMFRKGTIEAGTQQYQRDDCELTAKMVSQAGVLYGSRFDVVDWTTGSLSEKKNFAWKPVLRLVDGYAYGVELGMKLTTDYALTFGAGCIVVSGTVYTENVTQSGATATYHQYSANGWLHVRLKVGDKYYNSSSGFWSTTPAISKFRIGNGGSAVTEGAGSIVTNKSYTSAYEDYDGHGCAVLATDYLSGNVTLELVTFTLDSGSAGTYLVIEDLKLGFARLSQSAALSTATENTYTAQGGEFDGERDVSTDFATMNNNPPGLGLITNGGMYFASVQYNDNVWQRPEEHLAQRIAAFGDTRRLIFSVDIKSPIMAAITPRTKVTIPYGNEEIYPISIGRQWRDDVENVRLIQIH